MAKNSKKYVNGDIAIVVKIFKDRIDVMLTRQQEVVEVPVATWEQFDYQFNNDAKEIERRVVGTFTQLPVILAWAMTIHKSQGLTLEKVHIDMGAGSFETGQTYVALSRCRSMDTLSLAKPLKSEDVKVDSKSKAFYAEIRR
jgi:ATP-dependent exoDNAse (exonuclease V) alpha subunit